MITFIQNLFSVFLDTIIDVIPIVSIIFGFQFLVIRKAVPNLRKVIIGFIYVLIGLTLFLVGLELALFPLGEVMAQQLTDPAFIHGTNITATNINNAVNIPLVSSWQDYKWVYVFALAIGFSTTIAEPALLAVAIKANEVSAGVISIHGLRISVALGVAFGIALGTFRIVTGTPLHYYIIVGYIIVLIQTYYAPKMIIALAYDSGGVTTSTVTVPLVTALGLGLASTIPGRSELLDGFGLIAFASLCPIISVMAYAQLSQWRSRKRDSTVLIQENKKA